jgi:hypothetical protein
MRIGLNEETVVGALILAAAGVSPNIFPAAQAGYAKMSALGVRVLLPAVAVLIVLIVVAAARGHRRLVRRTVVGAIAGAIATVGLEAVRSVSFHLGGMPGDMPRLLGVLLTDRVMLGPSPWSDLLGYIYHFWNGVSFGLIFAVIVGRRSLWWALVYAEFIGLGFLVSPAVRAMGIGFMGLKMPAMPLTVLLAHVVFGTVLGLLVRRWLPSQGESCGRECSERA